MKKTLFALLLLPFVACNLDDKEEPETQSLEFVTIESVAYGSVTMTNDAGQTLNVEFEENAEPPKAGSRCFAHYRLTPLPMRLYSVVELKPQEIQTVTDENRDALGNDSSYYISLLNQGSDYLNVYFSAPSEQRKLSLVYNENKPGNADTAWLELRYKEGTPVARAVSTPVTFDLTALQQLTEAGSIVVLVDTKSLNSSSQETSKTYSFKYKWAE